MHPFLASLPHPRVLAHRGLVTPELAARGIVENTAAAVTAAVEAGADIIESDCRITRDGVVVLTHDEDLARTLGDPRAIADVAHRELAALFADRGGLLTLAEAFERFPTARFNIDVKVADAAEAAGRIIAPHAERALINSFSDERRQRALRAAVAAHPASAAPATAPGQSVTMRLLATTSLGMRSARARVLAGLDALQLPERQSGIRVVSKRLIEAAHRAGVEVHVWTVNDAAHMLRLVELGVDGIVTDRADVALETLRAYRGR